jgi:dethiobiotin synthetase
VTRPDRLVVVTGTGTGVGKTWVTAALAGALARRGLDVRARKPVQSYGPDEIGRTDADLLAAATGDSVAAVCPPHRRYPVPYAPPMAAATLGAAPFGVVTLVDELTGSWPVEAPDVGLVELAGGPRSPMAADGDGVSFVDAVVPDAVLLVADAGLGTINAVRLCVDALNRWRVLVLLNRFDPTQDLHRRNRDWLARLPAGPAGPPPVLTDVEELAARHPAW